MTRSDYPGAVQRAASWLSWRALLSLALSAGLLAYFLHRAPLAAVGRVAAGIRPGWLLVAVGLALSSYVFRGLRWGIILRPVGRAAASQLVGCTAVGFAASTVLPARAGEVARPLLLSAKSGLPAAGTIASILTERLVDLATVLALFGVGVAFSASGLRPEVLPALKKAALGAGLVLIVSIAVLAFLLRRPESAVERLGRLFPSKLRHRGERFLEHLLAGLTAVRDPRRLAELGVWSLLVWVPACWQIDILGRGFGLELGITVSFAMMAVIVLGLAVPTPGGVGGFHATTQFALVSLAGVDITTATAFALVHHAICFFPITVAGLAYLALSGTSLSRLHTVPDPHAGQDEGA